MVGYPHGRYMSIVFSLLQTRSTGYVHITSANDIYGPPDFYDGLLSDPLDVPPQRWAYKRGREIQRRMPAYRGEWAPSHPVFPEGSKAAVTSYNPHHNPAQLRDYEYSAEDDAAIDEWIRRETVSMCHPM
jgi:alcohol oxidase